MGGFWRRLARATDAVAGCQLDDLSPWVSRAARSRARVRPEGVQEPRGSAYRGVTLLILPRPSKPRGLWRRRCRRRRRAPWRPEQGKMIRVHTRRGSRRGAAGLAAPSAAWLHPLVVWSHCLRRAVGAVWGYVRYAAGDSESARWVQRAAQTSCGAA